MVKEQFIEKAIMAHGNRYDYSFVEYKNNKTRVKIVCRIHGLFEQVAKNHLDGYGCGLCGGTKKNTLEKFIEKAKKIHGDKYDYSISIYKNNSTKTKILCKKHDVFEQKPNDHLSGYGCPKCIGRNKTNKDFIDQANSVHNNKYDYSLIEYKNSRIKIKIICPKHGIFLQSPNSHLSGYGCSICKSSKGENKIRKYLIENNIQFEEQKQFNELGRMRYDFYLPANNLLIEYDGKQHFGIGNWNKDFKSLKQNDKIKNEFAEKNNITLIRIPYTKFNEIEKCLLIVRNPINN